MHNLTTIIGVLVLIVIAVFFMRARGDEASGTSSNNPVDEAELLLGFGRTKEAKAVLEKYLLSNPGNEKALNLLKQIN